MTSLDKLHTIILVHYLYEKEVAYGSGFSYDMFISGDILQENIQLKLEKLDMSKTEWDEYIYFLVDKNILQRVEDTYYTDEFRLTIYGKLVYEQSLNFIT